MTSDKSSPHSPPRFYLFSATTLSLLCCYSLPPLCLVLSQNNLQITVVTNPLISDFLAASTACSACLPLVPGTISLPSDSCSLVRIHIRRPPPFPLSGSCLSGFALCFDLRLSSPPLLTALCSASTSNQLWMDFACRRAPLLNRCGVSVNEKMVE
ncbi:unnamed protein product [Linum trigynum]|uniref:Uncharacterized protein n=1 Tax=Linum trigynum TaxID=586398 RepID=A0AAV2GK17_9ROSI